ncbi:hypothetical protein [Larkinella humicola]|uniref:Lipocalin-like protein n=1 Tax=Larkinella humicola TaxID=2607654 RepID=A0A5N1J0X0_9BACT|nr:hypothetical protein [Larkinella humicola]KAA9340355.1 hypothetical protein F0P93_31270 [Larkinella humicola]
MNIKILFSNFCTVWLVLFVAYSFTACKKDADPAPAPDLATQTAGLYTYSELAYSTKTVSADHTNLKGTITVTRQTETTVSLDVKIQVKSDGSDFMVVSVDNVELMETSSGAIALHYEGEHVGMVKGNTVKIEGVDDEQVKFTITATK